MNKLASYFIFTGMAFLIVNGESISLYAKNPFFYSSYCAFLYDTSKEIKYMAIGFGLMLAGYLVFYFSKKRRMMVEKSEITIGEDNQNTQRFRLFLKKVSTLEFINDKVSDYLYYIFVLSFIIFGIINFSLTITIFFIAFTVALLLILIVFTMKAEPSAKSESKPVPPWKEARKNNRPLLSMFLFATDYREHPFSVSLILYLSSIALFLIFSHFGIELRTESSLRPHDYIFIEARILPLYFVLLNTLLFINHNLNFLGLKPEKQGDKKILGVRFFELIICGIFLFVGLIDILNALYIHFF
ncbi:hypothetical protein SAMN05421736_11553 [Evansella caseinilytica]|uniref:Uncharacterized protein n=1 Tax=Evansella caseinilytica TaxID=1503961 RepID=A0A1H3TMF6_9BACI|nr:hypothetical protein [Evansella caseinilytica]SDZ50835.1 hypothetical protein SAMN05421736_11553 [Evansella caseinilytica]